MIRVLILLLLLSIEAQSQNGFTTNNGELEEIYERQTIRKPYFDLFQDMRPYNRSDVYYIFQKSLEDDSLLKDPYALPYLENELNAFPVFKARTLAKGKKTHGFFYPNPASFAAADVDILKLSFNPVIEFRAGREQNANGTGSPYTLTRGAEMRGCLGGQFNFYALITENQYKPFEYIRSYGTGFGGQNTYNFNPYFTYWKDINNNQGYDFSNSIGYLEYNPSHYVSVSLGHDRNFYGYGYRSLFLGDNGAPYLGLKVNAWVWKFHYHMMIAEFTGQYVRGADRLLPKKYGAFHMLSFKPSKKWELGIFEGVIFNRDNTFELNYLNPLVFYRSVEHSLGSPDNTSLGFQGKFQPNTHLQLYTQFLIDDMQIGQFLKQSGWWGNKYGLQLGLKYIDIAKIPTLDAQIEFNAVAPYTYTHSNSIGIDTIANFTHYNQPLAHPFGANFVEFFGKLSYRPIPKLRLELRYDFSARGLDNNGKLNGQNIFMNTQSSTILRDYDNKITQGLRNNLQILTLNTQYQLFHNLFVDLDVLSRTSSIPNLSFSENTFGAMLGLRMNLKKRDYLF